MPVYDRNVIDSNRDIVWDRKTVNTLLSCKKDIKYFAWKYCKVIHPSKGLISLDRRPYQKEWFKNFYLYDRLYVTAKRQTGKTTSIAIYALHKAMYSDRPSRVVICSNKMEQSKYILEMIKGIYANLPKFLKLGVKAWNKTEIQFDNDSIIYVTTPRPDNFRGWSLDCLILDEVAYSDITKEFIYVIYPCMRDQGSIVAITSTPEDNPMQHQDLFSKFVLHQTSDGAL